MILAGAASKSAVVFACVLENSGTVLLIWGELFGTMAALLLIFGRAGHLIVHFGVWRSPSSRKDGAIWSKMGSHHDDGI